jgi:inner membrane protein
VDPLTHALTGATLAWAVSHQHLGKKALLVGAVAGLLPDVDVLIRSASDPLLAIEHHRGFTHSLLMVPLGGLLAGLPFGRRAILPAILAYLSHALLDASTTYGTQLFWPFSLYRVGLDVLSILDPIFSIVALTGVVAAYRARGKLVALALGLLLAWMTIGYVQRERAIGAQIRLAASRGEVRARGEVFPTIGARVTWRSLYESGGTLHMDRIRVPWFGAAEVIAIATVPAVRETPERRFAWFTNGWMATDPTDPTVTGDARYSMHVDRYVPVWGIRLNPTEWVDRSRQRRFSR